MASKAMNADLLHKQVVSNIPSSHIKSTSTWVAIIPHTVQDVEDIRSSDDVLWVKAHHNVTMRTLTYQYYARHPLEAFKLYFLDQLPDQKCTISQLDQQYPFCTEPNSLIVLRAVETIEDESFDGESSEEESHTDAASFQRQTRPNANGCTANDPIILSDNEVEGNSLITPPSKETRKSHVSATNSLKKNVAVAAPKNNSKIIEESPAENGNHLDLTDQAQPDISQAGDCDQKADKSEKTEDSKSQKKQALLKLAQNSGFEDLRSIESLQWLDDLKKWTDSNLKASSYADRNSGRSILSERGDHNDVSKSEHHKLIGIEGSNLLAPLMKRVCNLTSTARNTIIATPTQSCGTQACGKIFHIQPWTEFNIDEQPMCTVCSWNKLTYSQDADAIDLMEVAVGKLDKYKDLCGQGNVTQDMDPDCPPYRTEMVSHGTPSKCTQENGNTQSDAPEALGDSQAPLTKASKPVTFAHAKVPTVEVDCGTNLSFSHSVWTNPAFNWDGTPLGAQQSVESNFNLDTMDFGSDNSQMFTLQPINHNSGFNNDSVLPLKRSRHDSEDNDQQNFPAHDHVLDFSKSPTPKEEWHPRKIRCVESHVRPTYLSTPSGKISENESSCTSTIGDPSEDERQRSGLATDVAKSHNVITHGHDDDSEPASEPDLDEEPVVVGKKRKSAKKKVEYDSDYEYQAGSEESDE